MNIGLFEVSGMLFVLYKYSDYARTNLRPNFSGIEDKATKATMTIYALISSISLGAAIPCLAAGVVLSLTNLLH